MRVIHVLRKYNPAEWGGTETALQLLLPELRRQGSDAVIYAPRLEDAPLTDPLAAGGAAVKRYRACLPVWGLPEDRRRQMLAVGGNLMSFDLPYALRREPNVELIHTHTMGRIGAIAGSVARARGVPFVISIHGGVLDLPETLQKSFNEPGPRGVEWGKLFGWLYRSRRQIEGADAILTCNGREATLLRARYPGRRIIVQPHGVPLEKYTPDHRAAAAPLLPPVPGRQVIICLGRIDSVKNQRWLVEEAPELLRRHPRAVLVFVGSCTDEQYGAAMRQRIAELGIAASVVLTGGLPPGDPRLIGLLQEADAIVLPSVSETFGLVILEAWAAGTPVISSRTSGAASLVRQGEDGWLFDLDRPQDFHTALDRTLDDAEVAAQLVAQGRRRVSGEYDSRVLATRVRKLYEELIAAKHWRAGLRAEYA